MDTYTIVSDPGIDDLVALLLFYRLSDKRSHTLISTFGNVPERYTAQNAKEFIAFVASNWNFIYGSKTSLKPLERPWATYFHGPDGVWNVHPQTDIKKVKTIKDFPRNEGVISLGPMTAVYKLFKKHRGQDITIMGGVFNEEGNETKYAETNIRFDPEAASYFFNTCQKINVKVVPLDVTRRVTWNQQTIENIPETNKINIWMKKLLITWFKKYNHAREENFCLHDPLAVYLTLFPNEATWVKSGIKIIIKGKQRGRTMFDENNPNCKIAMNLVDPKLIQKKICKLVFE